MKNNFIYIFKKKKKSMFRPAGKALWWSTTVLYSVLVYLWERVREKEIEREGEGALERERAYKIMSMCYRCLMLRPKGSNEDSIMVAWCCLQPSATHTLSLAHKYTNLYNVTRLSSHALLIYNAHSSLATMKFECPQHRDKGAHEHIHSEHTIQQSHLRTLKEQYPNLPKRKEW